MLLLLESEEESHWEDNFEQKALDLVARAGIDSAELSVKHAGTDQLVGALNDTLSDTDLVILRESEGTDRHALLDHLREDVNAPALVVLEIEES